MKAGGGVGRKPPVKRAAAAKPKQERFASPDSSPVVSLASTRPLASPTSPTSLNPLHFFSAAVDVSTRPSEEELAAAMAQIAALTRDLKSDTLIIDVGGPVHVRRYDVNSLKLTRGDVGNKEASEYVKARFGGPLDALQKLHQGKKIKGRSGTQISYDAAFLRYRTLYNSVLSHVDSLEKGGQYATSAEKRTAQMRSGRPPELEGVVDFSARLVALTARGDAAEAALSSARAELAERTERLTATEAERASLEARVEVHARDIAGAAVQLAQLEHAQQTLSDLQTKHAELHAELAEAKDTAQQVTARLAAGRAQIVARRAEGDQRRAAESVRRETIVADIKSLLETNAAERTAASARIVTLERQIAEVRAAAQAEMADLRATHAATLRVQAEELGGRIAEQTAVGERALAEVERLSRELRDKETALADVQKAREELEGRAVAAGSALLTQAETAGRSAVANEEAAAFAAIEAAARDAATARVAAAVPPASGAVASAPPDAAAIAEQIKNDEALAWRLQREEVQAYYKRLGINKDVTGEDFSKAEIIVEIYENLKTKLQAKGTKIFENLAASDHFKDGGDAGIDKTGGEYIPYSKRYKSRFADIPSSSAAPASAAAVPPADGTQRDDSSEKAEEKKVTEAETKETAKRKTLRERWQRLMRSIVKKISGPRRRLPAAIASDLLSDSSRPRRGARVAQTDEVVELTPPPADQSPLPLSETDDE